MSCRMEEDRSWEEALQILEKQQVDLIITDVMMPKMNGYENADNQQMQFIKDFSHEFKTPINSIKGMAGDLLQNEIPRGEETEYLGIISKEAGRLADLSQNTLLLSKKF